MISLVQYIQDALDSQINILPHHICDIQVYYLTSVAILRKNTSMSIYY